MPTPTCNGLYNVVHWLSIAAKMYDLEWPLSEIQGHRCTHWQKENPTDGRTYRDIRRTHTVCLQLMGCWLLRKRGCYCCDTPSALTVNTRKLQQVTQSLTSYQHVFPVRISHVINLIYKYWYRQQYTLGLGSCFFASADEAWGLTSSVLSGSVSVFNMIIAKLLKLQNVPKSDVLAVTE